MICSEKLDRMNKLQSVINKIDLFLDFCPYHITIRFGVKEINLSNDDDSVEEALVSKIREALKVFRDNCENELKTLLGV